MTVTDTALEVLVYRVEDGGPASVEPAGNWLVDEQGNDAPVLFGYVR